MALDPERAARVSALVAEFRPLLAAGTGMPAVQHELSARGVGVMDAVIVTRELLGAGPEALGQAKSLVLGAPARRPERARHQRLVDDLVRALDRTDRP